MISIIIPCYNTGQYLEDALESVFNCNFQDYEIIIVNDGSDDNQTNQILGLIKHKKIKIITQENKGLSSARNLGVRNSNGEFVLFLDSDNKILDGYFEQAIKFFKEDSTVGVVYSIPEFFGSTNTPRFQTKAYNFDALLAGNFIDACSFVRRIAFDSVGGFDENKNLRISEDWDLWIRLGISGWKFQFINEYLFKYRIREDSMIGTADDVIIEQTQKYLGQKYGYVIHKKYRQYYRVLLKIQHRPFLYFFKIIYYKYILRRTII
ncbi:glycosyltransferase [Belliella sp. DSM 111904]|uniref:Glycosyltransferase n=1 Tax=Belliella filtrata TaxID=2923435 RepID=A0ABS9UWU0_9BACT|nr:glycosyltransferase [Belliella filtrata]MCH7408646.1 glycosyltransferase [Belliella filtrata]